MTIAAKILNDEGFLLASADYPIPQLIARCTTSQFGADIAEGNEDGLVTRSYTASGVDFGGRDVIVYWRIPQGYWAYSQSTFLSAAASGVTLGIYLFVPPGTVINDPPVAYVFGLDVIRSAEPVALRMYTQDNRLTFDSSTLHLAIDALITDVKFNLGTPNTSYANMASEPAFLIPSVHRTYEEYEGNLNTSEGTSIMMQWLGCIKRSGNAVEQRLLKVWEVVVSASNPGSRAGYIEDQTYGNNGSLIMPIINSSLYN